METFYKTHAYLVANHHAPVRRLLMDQIDWSYRMIAIRGPRGVGRTSFLLQYAKEKFDPLTRRCLYVNMNNFYFQSRGIVDFAGEFVKNGGHVLLIDQAFKLTNWREQLCECYHKYPYLRIVYSTTSVGDEDGADSELAHLSRCYVLHGFSFREYINLKTGNNFPTFTLQELIKDHEKIARTILYEVRPLDDFIAYLKHGYYPFYLENSNFTEALLKAMNMMIEIDVLFNKQVELKYLARIKKLLFLIATGGTPAINVSKLAEEVGTSRATVMNYLKYLEEARLINMVYREGETFPQKPTAVYLHDTNLIDAISSFALDEQLTMETFLVNTLWRHHSVRTGRRDHHFKLDSSMELCVCEKHKRVRTDAVCFRYNLEMGNKKDIPIWLLGFLY